MFLLVLLLFSLPNGWCWWIFGCNPTVEGGECSAFCPCKNGMTCEAGVHVCRMPGGVGDRCHITRPCQEGLTCEAGSHVCRGPGETGDPCHLTRPCAPGYYCKSVVHTCERYAALTESCYPESLEHLGSRCDEERDHWCDAVTRTCVTPSRKGGPCGYMGGQEDEGLCSAGLSCECKALCDSQELVEEIKGNQGDGTVTLQKWVESGKGEFCCKCAN